jgi:hypothetical protein
MSSRSYSDGFPIVQQIIINKMLNLLSPNRPIKILVEFNFPETQEARNSEKSLLSRRTLIRENITLDTSSSEEEIQEKMIGLIDNSVRCITQSTDIEISVLWHQVLEVHLYLRLVNALAAPAFRALLRDLVASRKWEVRF